jgi:uncharacterized protein (DUF433 family)
MVQHKQNSTVIATELIVQDPEIMSGTPVFANSRVPVKTLFDYLKAGDPLERFLDHFPTVERALAVALLAEIGERINRGEI